MNGFSKASGSALALAVAGLMGGASATAQAAGQSEANTSDLVHCYGVNVCGGHNDCKTSSNACAGQASCEGTGFVGMSAKACGDVGGKVKDAFRGSISNANLIHCHGANICKGHNDCKGANNACAGQGECKGQGFVAIPAKSCGDIGGTAS